jgi:hypothetical protein
MKRIRNNIQNYPRCMTMPLRSNRCSPGFAVVFATSLVFLLAPRKADAQYFLGVGGGPYWIATDKEYVSAISAYDLGACLMAKGDDALAYAAHLRFQQRRFLASGYQVIDRSDRFLDLRMVIHMLAIGCDARVALGPSKMAFFDIGPEFCILFSEDKDGIAYTRDYVVNDTITYDHATRTLFEMRDIRFRTGFSSDINLSDHLLVNLGLHGSIGGGAWAPVSPGVSFGLQFSCNVLFNVHRKG